MIVGHYAAALIARPHRPTAPFWLFLLSANLAEFLWLVLALVGVEAPVPSSLLDASFQNLRVDMVLSHNLAPNLALSALLFVVVWLATRDRGLAIWCAALCHLHVWCDYLVGFEHQVAGRQSAPIGLNSYARFPELAIVLELAFAWLCIAYYLYMERRAGRTPRPARVLVLLFIFTLGILAWLPNARVSMREWAVLLSGG